MDVFFIILGLLLMVGGLIGSFLPILPGPITSWAGLLVLNFNSKIDMSYWLLGSTLLVAVLIFILDYVIPAIGTKKFGGTRYGMVGSTIGLIAGLLFLGPFGIIIGPFIGALAGELLNDPKETGKAVKAAFGSLIGFLTSAILKFTTCCVYLFIFLYVLLSS